MRTQKALRFTAVVTLLLLCAVPMFAARGTADFTRYVALGDSYGAGVSNGSLVISHQQYSYPAVIARQAHAPDFQQPLVSEPGIGPELILKGFTASGAPIIGPKAANNGVPINLALPRPYNNLSIPGLRAPEALTITGAQPPTTTSRATAQFILRGLGTAADQALALHPTFISVWLGGYDALVGVLNGSVNASTPLADFTAGYTALLDKLIAGAPGAGMVVADVPHVDSLPYATTVPPIVTNNGQPVLIGGQPIYMIADLGGGQIGQLPPGSLVTLDAIALMQTGYGLPPGIPSSLPNAGKPLPDTVTLTPTEVAAINKRADDINAVIESAAAARNIPVVDFHPVLEHLKAGFDMGGVVINNAFLTGGFWSYDGFHPTDIGYTLIANEFIKVINANYGSHIRLASLAPFFVNNATTYASSGSARSGFDYSAIVWRNISTMMIPSVPTEPPANEPKIRNRGVRR